MVADIAMKKIRETSSFLSGKLKSKPDIAIVLGSGLGSFAKEIQSELTIAYKDIPHFLPPTIIGHQGNLIAGSIAGKNIIAMQGRNHFYEGHSMEEVVFPTRVLGVMGVKTLILTNSAGGCGEGMQAGDLMIIEDHLNLTGTNPLIGPNLGELGPRFPDMSEAYNKELCQKLESVFQKTKVRYKKGIYGGLSGPTYETPAEVQYLKKIGCSAVGMSTVAECIIANHMGMRVAGISCITNLAAGIAKHKLSHDEVTETAKRVEADFSRVLKDFIALI